MSPVLTLGHSVRVELYDTYGEWEHGFVYWWELVDEEGLRSRVGFDDRVGSQTRYRLFEGARHPNQQGCVWIDLGSEEEGVIIPTLSKWLDSPETWKIARGFRPFEEFLERLQEKLAHHGALD